MKRFLDVLLVVLTAPLSLAIGAVIAAGVSVQLGRPVFFSQLRPGLNGRLFRMIKFRTMTSDRDSAGNLLADDLRLTSFGRTLRSSSLDELPELWNVLKGDMSLVGPRPLLPEYLPLYTPQQARRHEVRPGITGWAQINGRNAISWEEKFELDVWYVDHRSLMVDLKILLVSLQRIFSRRGISAAGEATMTPFRGTAA